MTAQARRRSLYFVACALAGLAACGSDPQTPPDDEEPCADRPVVPGGSVELGIGTGANFVPLVEGQDLAVETGGQGLLMFVVTVRTMDLEVGSGDQEGIVAFKAFNASGTQLSLEFKCRVREFVAVSGALNPPEYRVLASNYGLALDAHFSGEIEGLPITLQANVRDVVGHHATTRVTVTGRLPR